VLENVDWLLKYPLAEVVFKNWNRKSLNCRPHLHLQLNYIQAGPKCREKSPSNSLMYGQTILLLSWLWNRAAASIWTVIKSLEYG